MSQFCMRRSIPNLCGATLQGAANQVKSSQEEADQVAEPTCGYKPQIIYAEK